MPNSITQLVVGTAVALAMAFASVSVIGSAVAQSPVERAIAQEALTNRYESPISETDFRFGDHQQLRKLFLGN